MQSKKKELSNPCVADLNRIDWADVWCMCWPPWENDTFTGSMMYMCKVCPSTSEYSHAREKAAAAIRDATIESIVRARGNATFRFHTWALQHARKQSHKNNVSRALRDKIIIPTAFATTTALLPAIEKTTTVADRGNSNTKKADQTCSCVIS